MTNNTNLHKARKARQDEFYTRLEDVEAELQHYPNAFRGKAVYLNCDDERSAFWKYLSRHLGELGLKELVATKYPEGLLYRLKSAGGTVEVVELDGDGDFRSPECVEVLKQADVVVTNGPFSLLREFIAQLVEHDKKFLVIGNMNAITYKEIWHHIQARGLWLGVQSPKRFIVGDAMPDKAGQTINQSGEREQAFGNILWFTNLDHAKRHEELPLTKKYSPEEFPTYDNYDAIEVSKVKDIPADYDGVMGVPITFLDKWNPEQFEILGLDRYIYNNPRPGKRFDLNGKEVYARILIRRINQLGVTK